jgi:hypothetical protein
MNIFCIESFCQQETHNRMLLFSVTLLKHGRHFDYWNQLLNTRMLVYYLRCHNAGLCCYLVMHIENLLRPLHCFTSICDLFTDSPSFFVMHMRNVSRCFSSKWTKYSETSINRHSFNRQFLLTVRRYSMYSNQIAAKNHPRFTAKRRRRRSGALFCWWVTFLARLAIAHVGSFSCGWEAIVLSAVRYLLRSDLIVSAYDSHIHISKFCVKVSFLFLCNS